MNLSLTNIFEQEVIAKSPQQPYLAAIKDYVVNDPVSTNVLLDSLVKDENLPLIYDGALRHVGSKLNQIFGVGTLSNSFAKLRKVMVKVDGNDLSLEQALVLSLGKSKIPPTPSQLQALAIELLTNTARINSLNNSIAKMAGQPPLTSLESDFVFKALAESEPKQMEALLNAKNKVELESILQNTPKLKQIIGNLSEINQQWGGNFTKAQELSNLTGVPLHRILYSFKDLTLESLFGAGYRKLLSQEPEATPAELQAFYQKTMEDAYRPWHDAFAAVRDSNLSESAKTTLLQRIMVSPKPTVITQALNIAASLDLGSTLTFFNKSTSALVNNTAKPTTGEIIVIALKIGSQIAQATANIPEGERALLQSEVYHLLQTLHPKLSEGMYLATDKLAEAKALTQSNVNGQVQSLPNAKEALDFLNNVRIHNAELWGIEDRYINQLKEGRANLKVLAQLDRVILEDWPNALKEQENRVKLPPAKLPLLQSGIGTILTSYANDKNGEIVKLADNLAEWDSFTISSETSPLARALKTASEEEVNEDIQDNNKFSNDLHKTYSLDFSRAVFSINGQSLKS